jgi:dienelactone hydrolase/lysophospholipase L1-like esterase
MMNKTVRLTTILTLLFIGVAAQAKGRWLFLGDSITQAGHYVDYVETWFLLHEVDAPEIIDLGLSSETVSGLSEPDHPFPRPNLHTRLDRVLKRVKPDMVVACYGMNCGIYHPFSEDRFAAYQAGITKLINDTQAAGADIILLAPPPFAGRVVPKRPPRGGESYGYQRPAADYNAVLERYANWILSLDGKNGIRAFTLRPGLERFMEECYPQEPVHPNALGHALMAEAFLQCLGKSTGSDLLETGLSTRARDPRWTTLCELVKQQRLTYDIALLNDIGHDNPNVRRRQKMALSEALEKGQAIDAEINSLLRQWTVSGQETLPAIKDGKVPQTFDELWADFDPRAEPLEVEILKEWDDDGVVFQVVRYRIGVFKGQEAKMAAVYGYPKGARKLPGLVQIHGGGQYADYRAVLTNAKRGYATLSISWAGRINAPGYEVTPDVVKLFWEGKTDDPDYKLITDWGALDAYHAPCRNPKNSFVNMTPAPWTLDPVESPRNNPWFLCTLGARRALTFLEQQLEVDADRLGVYGHSMGGKLTVLTTAADTRVKAAAPSCGGISDRHNDSALFRATVGDETSLKNIACPIMFLSPANDFHGRINDLQKALQEIESQVWRVTCSAHHNHQDTAEYEVATQLWFDQHLKGTFTFPGTPQTILKLHAKGGVPVLIVRPDTSKPILYVDVFYTEQGQEIGEIRNRENRINRFWHYAQTEKNGEQWSANLALFNTDKPLWVYANVVYALDKPVTGAGYYYRTYATELFNLSSTVHMISPDELKAAGVCATRKPSLMIEAFEGDWEKEWFTYSPAEWARKTHKVYDPQWRAPASARLALEVRCEERNKLVVGIDEYAAEFQLHGGSKWQQIVMSIEDFHNASGTVLAGWNGIKELRLGSQETLREKRDTRAKPLSLGAKWEGKQPEFRNLHWIPDKKD